MWYTLLYKFLAGVTLKGMASVGGLIGIAALLNTLLAKLLDRRTERLKDERSAKEKEKERGHEVAKWAHEESVRDKERQHKAKERAQDRQHAEKLAFIGAHASQSSGMTLATKAA